MGKTRKRGCARTTAWAIEAAPNAARRIQRRTGGRNYYCAPGAAVSEQTVVHGESAERLIHTDLRTWYWSSRRRTIAGDCCVENIEVPNRQVLQYFISSSLTTNTQRTTRDMHIAKEVLYRYRRRWWMTRRQLHWCLDCTWSKAYQNIPSCKWSSYNCSLSDWSTKVTERYL